MFLLTKLKSWIHDIAFHSIKVNLAPVKDLEKEPCSRCGAPSSEQWLQGVCADTKTAGQWLPVCTECDILLNEMHLRFFFGNERDEDLKKYARIKRYHEMLRRLEKVS